MATKELERQVRFLPLANQPTVHDAKAPNFLKESAMRGTGKNVNRFVHLFVIAILLTNPYCLPFEVAKANSDQPSRLRKKAHKVSLLLQASKHKPDELVTVIVTLGATRSAGFIGFLNRNGIHQRK